ncbi:MAG: chemotaxis protein CheX [Lachnospiraceae bacterium]
MFTQLFGNFLLSKGVLTTSQLVNALKKQSDTHIKLGTLAIHAGLMSASMVDRIIVLQTHQDQKFGELAIEEGYLTAEQVSELLASQTPDYLLLGQILVEEKILSHEAFQKLLSDYQTENEIYDLSNGNDQFDSINQLICKFCEFGDLENADKIVAYLQLLFNNFIRFIGDDYTPITITPLKEYRTNHCAIQEINGEFSLFSALDMDVATAVAFASRYVGENFESYDDYVEASMEDFLNLHNGLFNVNMSNSYSTELSLAPPEMHSIEILSPGPSTYLLPIAFSFGTVNFILSI